ncbi:MAG: hypothetical protein HUU30_04910 [Burkholderiaceae bacterium]|jgi:hypothetical protein|nr:hypothetical protein [Burkholderiaceae bacterium]MCK6432919.1 hypothetical protein [Aquabacterium sp.]NUP85080.1 hypothetical protein [Burkholderiaceae bacterium]
MGEPDADDESGNDGAATWHLLWQAAFGRDCFAHPALFARIRDRLIDAHRYRGRQLLDYLVLPGEIHVVCRLQAGDAPERVARAFGHVVARWVRQVQRVRGPVFAEPYRAFPVESDADLRVLLRILAWRPVVQGECVTPTHHAQGALRITLGLSPASGFNARPLLNHFGESVIGARASMRSWIARRPGDRDLMRWALIHGLPHGRTRSAGPPGRGVVDHAAADLFAAAGPGGLDAVLGLLEKWVALCLGKPTLLSSYEGSDALRTRARALVASLAVRHGVCAAAVVARHYGKAKATLCEQMAACRSRAEDRAILEMPLERLLASGLDASGVGVASRRSGAVPGRRSKLDRGKP